MRRIQKPVESEPTSSAAPAPKAEKKPLSLRIEELEPRLTPQSSTSILD
jgi:hypothetical protein